MKNIFLKETNQESNLYKSDVGLFHTKDSYAWHWQSGRVNQFMYITNDEKIKFDEPYLGEDGNIYYLCEGGVNSNGKKIVMTNDTYLIEDGVQEVSSKFLSFFAENPVDYIKVKREEDGQYIDYLADGSVVEGVYENYSLDFPQKETKAEEKCKGSFKDCFKPLCECTCGNIIDNWLEKNGNPEISKQVEREAELYQTINKIIDGGKNLPKGFEVSRGQAIDYAFDVALEVAEKLYTEEDLHNAFYNGWRYRGENYTFPKAKKEWFGQFKKG